MATWQHIVMLFRSRSPPDGTAYVTRAGHRRLLLPPIRRLRGVFGQTVAQAWSFGSEPVLLSETAVGPVAAQSVKIGDLLNKMSRYGTSGLMCFNIARDDGIYHQDWHIEDSPAAEAAFCRAASVLTLASP